MSAWDEIVRATSGNLTLDDGRALQIGVRRGLSPTEVAALERERGFPLPRELAELLQRCSGIEGPLDDIDFTGSALAFEFVELLPRGIPIAPDGCGNFWVIDAGASPRAPAPVFFACHDPPVLIHQSPDLDHFLHETFRLYQPPHTSLLDDVTARWTGELWKRNPATMTRAAAAASADATLRAFAQTLDDRFLITDLRCAETGAGFSWGRHGSRTVIRRAGLERIFACAPP
ncbi:MAG TPA: SMI1/KNR4 family protein [Anaeromyxobacteraceae bacterium]|nr:SMI1/KNR4 family protein [Anaeromyxobacteraceae bacterium]